jgi:hypothetical protein
VLEKREACTPSEYVLRKKGAPPVGSEGAWLRWAGAAVVAAWPRATSVRSYDGDGDDVVDDLEESDLEHDGTLLLAVRAVSLDRIGQDDHRDDHHNVPEDDQQRLRHPQAGQPRERHTRTRAHTTRARDINA